MQRGTWILAVCGIVGLIAGIGFGTFMGNAVFIFGGQLIVNQLNAHQDLISWIIGGVFAVTAIIMTWRILRKKKKANYKPKA